MLQIGSYWCPGLHKNHTTKTSLEVNVRYADFFSVNPDEKSRSKSAEKPLKIPVFQRRYCWSGDVLSLWVKEAMFGQSPALDYGSGHSLGLVVVADCPQYRLLIDGQQRTLTALISLIALRDVFGVDAMRKYLPWVADDSSCPLTVARLDADVMEDLWRGRPVSPERGILAQSYHRICTMVAERLRRRSLGVVVDRLAHNVLRRCHFKVYTVEESHGPQLFQWIQEKSALNRVGQATQRQCWNPHPGQGLTQVDLMRNHLLSFFMVGAEAELAYDELWLPLETRCRDLCGLTKHMSSKLACDETVLMKTYLEKVNQVVGGLDDDQHEQRRKLVRSWMLNNLL